MRFYQPPAQPPFEPQRESVRPRIEQRLCLVCGMVTLIKLCWYLFQQDHPKCDVWACYHCQARNYRSHWWKPEASIIHTNTGYGDKVGG